jgi:hypothetical protein
MVPALFAKRLIFLYPIRLTEAKFAFSSLTGDFSRDIFHYR